MTKPVRILRTKRVESVFAPHRWDYEAAHGREIDAYWRRQAQANPKLYDGPVLLGNRVDIREEGASLRFFETRFSRFLYMRDFGFPDSRIYNCFSMPALRSADGAFLLGVMGGGHSSEGRIYFPAGTPDPFDVTGEAVDLLGSLIRELAEETGIDAAQGALAPDWTIVVEGPRVACMKLIEHPEPADAILARVEDFLAREPEPELAGALMISRRDQLDDPRLPRFMRAFLEVAL